LADSSLSAAKKRREQAMFRPQYRISLRLHRELIAAFNEKPVRPFTSLPIVSHPNHYEGAMKSFPMIVLPATADTGRIRLGGGWRLPATKPAR
jgi:hypothetical protein